MKALAEALLNLAAFLELSGDDVVDPDAAVSAMEDMTATLQHCTPEEKKALREVAKELAEQERMEHGREEARRLYLGFVQSVGLAAPRRKGNRSGRTARTKTATSPTTGTSAKPHQPDLAKRFWQAIQFRDTATASEVLKRQPALAKATGKLGITALHWAAQSGKPDLVRLLLDNGAEINAADDDGNTALHWAALGNSREDQETARLLIARGADVTAKNKEGQTPRRKAAAFGKNAVLLSLSK